VDETCGQRWERYLHVDNDWRGAYSAEKLAEDEDDQLNPCHLKSTALLREGVVG
jgi:hypothetical protein